MLRLRVVISPLLVLTAVEAQGLNLLRGGIIIEEEANISASPSILRGRISALGLACLVDS